MVAAVAAEVAPRWGQAVEVVTGDTGVVGGVAAVLPSFDCETTYGTPIEAPSRVANIRGRLATMSNLHRTLSSFSAFSPDALRYPARRSHKRPKPLLRTDCMTTSAADIADYRWLTGPEAAAILADLSGRAEPVHLAAERLRKSYSSSRAHLLLEQAELRCRAAAKFDRAECMFFTRLGLEQATDQWVAAYKARRFAAVAEGGQLADLCCGIGGDLLALGDTTATLGIDRDSIAACFAAANTQVHDLAHVIKLEAKEVEDIDIHQFAAWHIDPDRRPGGQRTTAIEWSSPSLEAVERLLAISPKAAIKLAPAAEIPGEWSKNCELEWISRDRECRQLVAWYGTLAQSPGRRTATVLATDDSSATSFVGVPNLGLEFASLDQHLFEPDAAVLAAHLGGALAAQWGLSAISAGIAYLTGPKPFESPLASCFAVEAVLPLDIRKIADALRERGIGRLEIKKRGVDHNPEAVRKQLALHGDDSAVLILTKINGKHAAILSHRHPSSNN